MDDKEKNIISFDVPEEDVTTVKNESPEQSEVEKLAAEKKAEQDRIKAEKKAAKDAARAKRKEEKAAAKASGEPQYVTKQFMIICLVVCLVISSALGAGIALLCNNNGGSSSGKHYDNLSESDLAKATGSELTIAQIVAKNQDAVVEIVVEGTSTNMFGQTQVSEGAGSGVIVNEKGYIVTNYHVIEGASKVKVTLHNGDTYNAQIVGGDDQNDIAVVKISADNLTVAEFGDSSTLAVGDLAVAIGNPLGQLGGTATSGIVSALDRRLTIDDRTLTLIQTDAAINAGNSGGGLFNGAGELVGIVDAKSSGTGIEGLAFAIPVNSVKSIINDLITTGKVSGKPAIGITIYEVSEANAQYYKLDGEGVYVAEVTGSNAQKAGYKEGDKIISINGKKIDSSSDFIARVRENKIGDTVTVVVERDGQEIEIKSKLEESVETSSSSSSQQQQQQQQTPQQGQDGGSIEDYLEQFGFGW